jgi:hypothetical protein
MSAVGILALASLTHASAPPHLDEMPPVDRVLAVQGRDRLDTAARQVVILQQLIYMVGTLSDGRQARDQLTTDERRLVQTYAAAIARVQDRILTGFEPEGSHRQQAEETWAARRAAYAADDAFRRAILGWFFSREWQANYHAVASRQRLELAKAPAPRSFVAGLVRSVVLPVSALGATAVGVFFVARTLVRRRRASRIEQDAPFVDVLEASAREALRNLRRATAVTAGRRGRR